jgi:hypothetical protein
MVDAGIGWLLNSSLHQGIGYEAPTGLDSYENWLSPAGIRDGRLGLAPLGAVFYAAALQRVFELSGIQAEVTVNAQDSMRSRLEIVIHGSDRGLSVQDVA